MNKKICSVFSIILSCIATAPVNAAVKITSGRSYADAYNQVNAVRQQAYIDANTATYATTTSATESLPVAVEDARLAEDIANNTSKDVTMSDLDACSMIYPNGLFKWGIPESGVRKSTNSTCVAVVELRDVNDKVLATTTVAAGDTIKCNIDSFPESGMISDLKNGKIEVPADNPPTLKDVEEALNEEQKQNAGVKIAAAALISGIAGNMLAPKESGSGDKLMGTGRTQVLDTFVGASAGAGIMAASTYSGKVAGDTIKSTAVNAASGMLVGNMMAGASGSGSMIKISKCEVEGVEKECVFGKIEASNGSIIENGTKYFINKSGQTYKCRDENSKYTNCVSVQKPLNSKIGDKQVDLLTETDWSDIENSGIEKYTKTETNTMEQNPNNIGDFYQITGGEKIGSSRSAFAVYDNIPAKMGGYSVSDFRKSSIFQNNPVYYARNSSGTVGACLYNCPLGTVSYANFETEPVFTPNITDASDGGLIDLSNQARTKGTLVGTAAGGAMGAIAGHQGAQDEITQRWTDAMRVYNDSLTNFYCGTGTRFLEQYNNLLTIPRLKKQD